MANATGAERGARNHCDTLFREEPLGELPGGLCVVGGRRTILLNLERPAADRLAVLLGVLAGDPAVASQPVSRLLSSRLRAVAGG